MMIGDQFDLWYKNAIFYCVDVAAFYDSNGDGSGDLEGLTSKLDYLAGLGVTALWLLPFYPSPRRDGGYDVTDYYGVDPKLGSLGDFVNFTRAARDRGMRVLIDLVVQHTSSEHPWFQAARSSRDSPYHDFYVWNQKPPPHRRSDLVFPGEQHALWTYVPEVTSYYRHRFYDHQPDLNTTKPAVRDEIAKIIGFWLELGVCGFRLDAAPFLMDYTGMDADGSEDPYSVLHDLRRVMSWRRGDAVLLAEANIPPDEAPNYFQRGHGVQMMINFWLNQHLFLALAQERAEPLRQAICALPLLPPQSAWANFLRNHDELNLGRLTYMDREHVYSCFAADPSTRIYDRGIRRRLAAMLGDTRRVELAFSLILSLPGTPVLFYGDELGMGDDLSQPARLAVRTAMQWSDQLNAGFSTAAANALHASVICEGRFGYRHINVAALEREPNSLFNRITRLIRTRKQCPEIGWGELLPIATSNDAVFAHICSWRQDQVLAVHNLSSASAEVVISRARRGDVALVELVRDSEYPPVDSFDRLFIGPWGYRWFRFGTGPLK